MADSYSFKSVLSFQVDGAQGLKGAAKDVQAVGDALGEVQRQARTRNASAYDTLGLRSIGQVKAEVLAVRGALATLKGSAGPADLARAAAAAQEKLKALNNELRGTSTASARAGDGLSGVAGRIAGIATAALGAREALEGVKRIIDSGLALEKQESLFNLGAGGDVEAAARALEFARAESDRLGLSLGVASEQFGKLTSATVGTELASQSEAIFSGIAEYATVARLSAEDFNGVMLAVNQVVNKGTLSSEELKQQIGERLPGAFKLAAQAMGVTRAELSKLLDDGAISSAEFLPRFAEALRAAAAGGLDAATQSTQAQLQRLANAFEDFKQRIARAGVFDAIGEQVTALLDKLGAMAESGELEQIVNGIADFVGSAITFLGNATQAAIEFRDEIGLLVQAVVGLKVAKTVFGGVAGLNAALGASGTVAPVAAAGLNAVALAMRAILPLAIVMAGIELAKWLRDVARDANAGKRALREYGDELHRIRMATQGSSGIQILSGEQLLGLTDEDLKAYKKRLEQAVTYHNASAADAVQRNDLRTRDFYLEQAEEYEAGVRAVASVMDERVEMERRMKDAVIEVRRGMLAELQESLRTEQAALKQANTELSNVLRDRQRMADQFTQVKAQVAAPGGSNGGNGLSLTDINLSVMRAETLAGQSTELTGDVAQRKAQEAKRQVQEALQLVQQLKREDDSRETKRYNQGDYDFMIRRLEQAGEKAQKVDEQIAGQKVESAKEQVASIEAKIAELSKPIQLDLMIDPNNLSGIRAAIEAQLKNIPVSVSVAGGDAASAPGADAPARAFGGALPGFAAHDRADNTMYWGTPGEWVIQRPTVRGYGNRIMAAFNAGLFRRDDLLGLLGGGVQRRAFGGQLDAMSLPTLSPGALQMTAPGAGLDRGTFVFGGESMTVMAESDVFDRLQSIFRRAELRGGSR